MVAVLCSQRDRFRARALEVEAHLATLGQELKRVGGVGCGRRAAPAGLVVVVLLVLLLVVLLTWPSGDRSSSM